MSPEDKKKYDKEYKAERRVIAYLDPQIRAKIERLAEKEHRSVSKTIEILLLSALGKRNEV